MPSTGNSGAASPTHMAREVAEIPEAISRCLTQSGEAISHAAASLRAADPQLLVTVARGSSDHAATFLNYAVQITTGIPVVSLAPSIVSVFDAQPRLANAATLAISQSGESPDLIAATRTAKASDALTLVLTNTAGSTLAKVADCTIDIAAGPEKSVAATKSFVSSIVAGLAVLAEWQDDDGLRQALKTLPDHAEKALRCDWSVLSEALIDEDNFYVLGRGPAFAIANEVALKFKETCGLHAEAYSSAEVMHGPLALVESGFKVLVLAARDAALKSARDAAGRLADEGAEVFVTDGDLGNVTTLPHVDTGHPLTDALCLVVPFYNFVEQLSRRRCLDPDAPPRLRKVTETH